jgi:hypothetical protein
MRRVPAAKAAPESELERCRWIDARDGYLDFFPSNQLDFLASRQKFLGVLPCRHRRGTNTGKATGGMRAEG